MCSEVQLAIKAESKNICIYWLSVADYTLPF